MSTNVVNQVAYLRTSRNFPEDIKQLSTESAKSYIDIATAVNNRIISIFTVSRAAINGESWFITQNKRQQGFRQVYSFTTTASINHGLNLSEINAFVRNWGEFTDSATGNWYGLIHGSNVAIAGQRSFYITPTQIVFLAGAGAPPLTSGTIVLEWISEP